MSWWKFVHLEYPLKDKRLLTSEGKREEVEKFFTPSQKFFTPYMVGNISKRMKTMQYQVIIRMGDTIFVFLDSYIHMDI